MNILFSLSLCKLLSKLTNVTATTVLLVAGGTTSAQAAFFMGLGDLPGGDFHSEANGVSTDGSVVVGFSSSSKGIEAFRWTASGGMDGLGDLQVSSGNPYNSIANGVSGDGSIVVGQGRGGAFRWTESEGMRAIGQRSIGERSIAAHGISSNGKVIVGETFLPGGGLTSQFAFRWTESSGMDVVGRLTAGVADDVAYAVTGDGNVVVGQAISFRGYEAFRWTNAGSLGLQNSSVAYGVSGDGSVVVGQGRDGAFLWTKSEGMVGLGDLPGGDFGGRSRGVSADGGVIVGQGRSDNGREAFIWNASNGMLSLQVFLTDDLGLNLTGWQLTEARAISSDGSTIVGIGTNPDGNPEAWIANLDSETVPKPQTVPEPRTILGSVMAVSFGSFFKRELTKEKKV